MKEKWIEKYTIDFFFFVFVSVFDRLVLRFIKGNEIFFFSLGAKMLMGRWWAGWVVDLGENFENGGGIYLGSYYSFNEEITISRVRVIFLSPTP